MRNLQLGYQNVKKLSLQTEQKLKLSQRPEDEILWWEQLRQGHQFECIIMMISHLENSGKNYFSFLFPFLFISVQHLTCTTISGYHLEWRCQEDFVQGNSRCFALFQSIFQFVFWSVLKNVNEYKESERKRKLEREGVSWNVFISNTIGNDVCYWIMISFNQCITGYKQYLDRNVISIQGCFL